MKRRSFASSRALVLVACVLACSLLANCSGKIRQAGGLEVIVKSDLGVPQDLTAVSVAISQQTASGWAVRFRRDVVLGGPVQLPATFTIAAGASTDEEALVDVSGLDGQGQPSVFSETLVQVPTDRVAEIIVFLAKTCVGKLSVAGDGGVMSGCQPGQTCDPSNGGCMSSLVADPPNYRPQDVTATSAASGGEMLDATLDQDAGNAEAGSCPSGQTQCNGACTTLATDPRNCGACGNDCAAGPNVSATGATCSAGRCAYVCQPAYADCADAGTGCGTFLGATATCGGCSAVCSGAMPVCGGDGTGAYACTSSCPAGAANCNGTCATLASDANNCGTWHGLHAPHANAKCASSACAIAARCRLRRLRQDRLERVRDRHHLEHRQLRRRGLGCTAANATPACVGSACAVGSCNAGYTDCDKLASTGCEVHTALDVNNCGACGHVCSLANANAACSGGSCAVGSCLPGYADCDGIASNGCETNLTVAAHCGACTGSACSGGTPVCLASSGSYSCVSGCPGTAPTLCNGTSCVDTTADPLNCGGCGDACTVPHASAACASSAGIGVPAPPGSPTATRRPSTAARSTRRAARPTAAAATRPAFSPTPRPRAPSNT